MSLTLADVQVTMTDDIDFNNIDEARKSSFVLDRMSFENTVSPDTNGGTLTTGYTRTITERAADTRQQNTEYPAREARKQKYTVDLIPLGARYNVDRVYAGLGDATTNQVVFQQAEARKATIAKFHDLFINGVAADFAQAVPEFDGLDDGGRDTSRDGPSLSLRELDDRLTGVGRVVRRADAGDELHVADLACIGGRARGDVSVRHAAPAL